MRCDAGRGCEINCAGDCVAMWDSFNLCQKACLGGGTARAMRVHEPFRLSLRASGPQVRALFEQYLPREIADALDQHPGQLQVQLEHGTLNSLVAELAIQLGGQSSSTT